MDVEGWARVKELESERDRLREENRALRGIIESLLFGTDAGSVVAEATDAYLRLGADRNDSSTQEGRPE